MLDNRRQQAVNFCLHDTMVFRLLGENLQQHPHSGLFILGLVPAASMYVVESHNCLVNALAYLSLPKTALPLNVEDAFFKASRHRAKLLDSRDKKIDEVCKELMMIAENQRNYFQRSHTGLFAFLKRRLQPDMGLFYSNGHIFSTTHSIIFGFGEDFDFMDSVEAHAWGYKLGNYVGKLCEVFDLDSDISLGQLALTNEMRDIRYEAIYTRGQLGTCSLEFTAGLILLLANLNYVHYVLRPLLPAGDVTLFRLKFITAFHAMRGLQLIQGRLRTTTNIASDVTYLFGEMLGHKDGKWLRKQNQLRNMLVHYMPDEAIMSELPTGANYIEIIEHLGHSPLPEMDTRLDRYIAHLSSLLEEGFTLEGDPFRLGKVS